MVPVSEARWCIALMVLSSAAFGCEGETEPSPKTVDHIAAIRAACSALAERWCASSELCHSADFASTYGDATSCLERRATLCERTSFGDGATTTPEQVAACALATDLSSMDIDARCRTFVRREEGRSSPDDCVAIGTLPDDSECLVASQCLSGCCAPVSLCGVCREPGQKGSNCLEDADCAPALACAAGKCALYGAEGANCGVDAPCQPDLACKAGLCGPRSTQGQSCDPAIDGCALWPVELACTKAGVCEPYQLALEGEECGSRDDGHVARCSHGLMCKATQSPPSGHCVPAVEDRAGCVQYPSSPYTEPFKFLFGGPCLAPAVCLANRCQIPDSAACGVGPPP